MLHVDDDPHVGELVATVVSETTDGVEVVTETDAVAGLERLGTGDVDCVVSDVEMPGTDGLAFADRLADDHPDVPVVLFTSRPWEDVADSAGADHVAAHVRKAGDPERLETLVEQVTSLLA